MKATVNRNLFEVYTVRKINLTITIHITLLPIDLFVAMYNEIPAFMWLVV